MPKARSVVSNVRWTAPLVSPFTPGVWTDITPPVVDFASTFGIVFVAIAPSAPGTLYANADDRGVWKSTNFGTTWTRLGSPYTYDYSGFTTYIDAPSSIEVNPVNANHCYLTQGVRGSTLGFWKTTDGGATWNVPAGFATISSTTTTNDVVSMAVDPTDFNHVLVGSHSRWQGDVLAGIMETTDGGLTFRAIAAPSTWPNGTHGIVFLYDPATGQGNSNTWLVMTDGDGLWRTTNAGSSWTKVSTIGSVHGGCRHYYAADGKLYIGGQPYPQVSADNGVTWTQLTSGLTSASYYQVFGDGQTLYTQVANTGDNALGSAQPWKVTPELSPGAWTSYAGGAQTFIDGPLNMMRDAANDIIYAACWKAGLLAMKVAR
jgi:hypothetical protein